MLNAWTAFAAAHPWVRPLGQVVALVAAAWVLQVVVIANLRRWAARTNNTADDAAVSILAAAIRPLLLIGVLAASLNLVDLPPRLLTVTNRALVLVALAVALWYASRLFLLVLDVWLARRPERQPLRDPVNFVAQVLFAGFAVMIVLDNLGISLTAVWTTLGVGSVAVALALQDTLSNFFAGVYLRLDNPVRLGDYVKLAGGEEGFVLHIGWRSTRIRTLPNNVVVVPNAKLASAIVTNYSLPQPEMSLLISVSVSYDSDPDAVEAMLVEEATLAAGSVEGLLGEPAPFVRFIPGFGESSLDFTLICRVGTFVDQYLVQHELRKRILRRFRREGVTIPYPQRDLHMYAADAGALDAVQGASSPVKLVPRSPRLEASAGGDKS